MTEQLDRLVAEAEIARLIADYAHFVDTGRASLIATLFTEDARWEGPGVVMEGRGEIEAGFARRGVTRRTSRHVCTNLRIDVLSPTEAAGTCYLINYRHDAEGEAALPAPADLPKYVGDYHDRFVRTPEGWRFRERLFRLAFLRPPTPATAS